MASIRPVRAAALACTFIAPVARAQAPQSIGTREGTAPPLRAPLSPEARETLERCVPLDGLRADLVASEPLLTNPVAFFIDRLGRFFVVETDRVNRGVTDLRSHMDWLEEDLAARTVADRVALYRRHSPSDAFEATYAAHEDRVVRLVDRDADGVLDERTVFADGYSRPESGVAAGFLATTPDDGSTDAWFTCIPDLVRMVDSDGDGRANVESVHTTGFGLRVALLGHDLHGLEIGPDARLYFSCGDRGFNVTTAEGRRLVRYGTGAVFRCELDGSDLELFCDGLRNPQELVFDDEGNLFTLDNNSDAGDEARWTFLVEGSDSGWRQAYQWANDVTPRGPWIAEGLCVPHHSDQPAYVLPPIANLTDGPSGMCAYPGTGWGEDWRGAFFVCDFRGNPGYSGIRALWNEPSGAGFTVSRTEKPVWDCLPTDCAFGPDGRLYWTDWITGWGGVGKGRIVALGPERRTEAEARSLEATGRFLARPLAELGAAELVAALRAPDRRVRMRAQLGLAERVREEGTRDGALTLLCAELLRADGAGRRHAAWCAAHVARTLDADDPGRRALLDRLASAFTAADPGRDRGALIPAHVDVLLAQSGDAPLDASVADGFARGALSALRQGASPALVRQRVEAWGRVVAGAPEADTGPVVEALLDERSTRDPWLRASFVRALERHGDPRVAIELLGAESVGARRVGVVVLRRLGHTGVAAALADPDVGVRAEAARAVHDVPIQAALPALARRLEYAGEVHEWTLRRAIHACRAVADERCAARLAAFASDGARDAALRAEALRVLARWGVPATRDGIVRDHRPLAAGDVEVLEVDRLTGGAFGAAVVLLADEGLARAALDLHALHGRDPDLPLALARAAALPSAVRASALEGAVERFPLDGAVRARIAELLAGGDEVDEELRTVALSTLPDAEAAEHLVARAAAGALRERRASVRALARILAPVGPEALARAGAALALDDPALVEWLEVTEELASGTAVAEEARRDPSSLASVVRSVRARLDALPAEELGAWRMCLEGGDPAAGERVFTSHAATSCTRCHAWRGEGGSEAGPALAGAGSRLSREEILRAIVRPNDEIAEGYEAWLLALDGGEIVAGRIVEETDAIVAVETLDPESGELAVFEFEPSEIVTRRRDVSAMPADLIEHLSPRQVRDLVAFIASLDETDAERGPDGH